MNRAVCLGAAVLAFALMLAIGPATDSRAAGAPAKITFLAASCPGTSTMYTRVAAGQDPRSNDHGTPAMPSDIEAYGCSPASGLGFFLLGGSASGSLFEDEGLTRAFTVSASSSGPSGGATTVQAGATAFAPGGVNQARRLSVNAYPTTVTTRAAMPFLDLQCGTDGVNSDNADGAGWNGQAFAAGSQNYCIAYTWDGAAGATPSPTATASPKPATVTPAATAAATSSPAATPANPTPQPASASTSAVSAGTATATTAPGKPVKFKLSVREWSEDKGKGKWNPASPEGSYTFVLSDGDGTRLEEFTDADDLDLASGDYVVSLTGPSDVSVYDFVLSENGKSDCKEPKGGRTSLALADSVFEKPGTIHACAYVKPSGVVASVSKTFVSATDSEVTWKLAPDAAADLRVWDARAKGCEAFGGAKCGDIAEGGSGEFSDKAKDQYLLVIQPFKKDGESCKVANTAEWAASESGKRSSVSASYECSGASTMGWGLFALFATGAAGVAWIVQRKIAWER